MKHNVLLIIMGFIASLMLTSCGNKAESLMEKGVSKMEEVASILKTVTDKKSAEAAKPKLAAIAKEMESFQKEVEALKLTKEEEKALEDKYKDRMGQAMKDLMSESMRIAQNPELLPVLQELESIKPSK